MIEKKIREVSIKTIDLVKYAGASRDFNPVHTEPEAAKKMGHPDVIAHGMYVMGLASKAIDEWFPNEKINKFQVRFMAPTYPGDLLRITGSMDDDYVNKDIIKGKIEIVDANDMIKLKGSFEMLKRGGRKYE